MALTLTQVELSAAIRLGDNAEEIAEATRLLAFTTEAVSRHLGAAYEAAPEVIVNEAAIRLAGYLFDQPNAGRGLSFANAGRNSGAWTMLLPFRVHRAGSTGEAVAAAQEAVGTTGNPVINVAVVGADLVITFDDGTTRDEPLPAGTTGDGTDQAALPRRPRRKGRRTVRHGGGTAQSDIDAHEANHPSGGAGVDQAARDAAAAAQGTANNAATAATAAAATANANTGRLDAFPAGTGGVDQTARDAADGAQGTADAAQADLDTHEGTPHNHDTTARDAAAERRRRRRHRVPSLPMSAPRTTRTARPERRRRRHRLAPMMPSRWPMKKLTLRARRRRRGKSQLIGRRTKIPTRSRRRNW